MVQRFSKAYLPFVHLTIGFGLLTWGLEAALPFSVWRIGLGLYLLLWFGWEPLYTIGRMGAYLVGDIHKATTGRLEKGRDE